MGDLPLGGAYGIETSKNTRDRDIFVNEMEIYSEHGLDGLNGYITSLTIAVRVIEFYSLGSSK